VKKKREQELKLLPLSKNLNENKYKCVRCGANLKNQFFKWLHELTGMPVNKLKNGDGLKEISWKLQIAERTLTIAGIEINEAAITEKALQYVEKLLSKRLSEEEREKYELQLKHKDEIIKNLEKEYNELNARLKHVPTLIGSEQEQQLLTRLEAISRNTKDEFYLEKASSLGEDILAKVIDNDQEIAKVIIESKKVKKWQSNFIDKMREDMSKHKTTHGIIATTAMPANALNNAFYITQDGIWVVKLELAEYAYRAKREFIVDLNREKLTEKQIEEVMKLFKERVLSDSYQGKLVNIINMANKIEKISKQIQSSTEKRCKSLRNQAKEIRNEINWLINENREIIKQVKTTKL
jgi:conjugal transfer/entry exclusion protein